MKFFIRQFRKPGADAFIGELWELKTEKFEDDSFENVESQIEIWIDENRGDVYQIEKKELK